jgi:hypothetical protein
MIRFSDPAYLLLGAVLIWLWRSGRRDAVTMEAPCTRRWVRCAAAGLLILAAAGLQLRGGDEPLSVMVVADSSDSVSGSRFRANAAASAVIAGLLPEDRAGVVLFAANPIVERPLRQPAPLAAVLGAAVQRTDTNIEAALRLARTSLPPAGFRRIVLVSDGRQTRGDALREAVLAGADGIPVDVIPAGSRDVVTAGVRHLVAPASVNAGEPFPLVAVLYGPAGARGELSVESDRGLGIRRNLVFSSEGRAEITETIRETVPGVAIYRAGVHVAADDPLGIDTTMSAGAVVTVAGESRVLYATAGASRLPPELMGQFATSRVEVAQLPASAIGFAPYDAIVLDDVAHGELTAAQLTALAAHVEHRGAGLIVLGGRDSLDATLTPDSGVGELLPIDFRPRAGARAPEAALIVVFDKSGSMDERSGGATKIESAREGIRQVLGALPPTDALGIIAFDRVPTVVAPLRSGHDANAILPLLRELEPGGSTSIAPALRRAQELLASSTAPRSRQHVLLVSDGRTSPADAGQVAQLVTSGGISMSVFHLGDDRDRAMWTGLAAQSGGRGYFPRNAQELPALIARETVRIAGGQLVEESFVPQLAPHPLSADLAGRAIPTLGGYVVGAPRSGSEIAMSSHRGDPILATWRYGLGKVTVYTADAHASWSARLRASGVLTELLARAIAWTARDAANDAVFTRLLDRGGQVILSAEVTDGQGEFVSLLDTRASVRQPSGFVENVSLAETRPGRYEARLTAPEPGAYVVSVSARDRNSGRFTAGGLRGFYHAPDREHPLGPDHAFLARLAAVSGGRLLNGGVDWVGRRPPGYHPLRSWLLAAAFFVFLAELLVPHRHHNTRSAGERRYAA